MSATGKPVEIFSNVDLMCGVCQKPIAAELPFIPIMWWLEERVPSTATGPDGLKMRIARNAYVGAGFHIECIVQAQP